MAVDADLELNEKRFSSIHRSNSFRSLRRWTKGAKVESGHQFTVRPGEDIQFKTYWKVQFKPVQTEEDKLVQEVRDAIFDSVKVHMRSDVPVGSFLSGALTRPLSCQWRSNSIPT